MVMTKGFMSLDIGIPAHLLAARGRLPSIGSWGRGGRGRGQKAMGKITNDWLNLDFGD